MTNVYGPWPKGRFRNAPTCPLSSFAMTLTCGFGSEVIPRVSTSFSIRQVETPSLDRNRLAPSTVQS